MADNRRFLIGLARAFGGAIIFSMPMLMTMEMWQLGFYMDRWRLCLFLLLNIPLLAGLSFFSGFEEVFKLRDEVVDAFVAYAVGFAASTAMLLLFAVVERGTTWNEMIGMISLQAVPASIGAVLARSLLKGSGEDDTEKKEAEAGYGGELFLMAVGALFLALNVAPTEEMVLIAHKMTEWHALASAAVSLLLMHAFVYAVEFKGQAHVPSETTFWSVFLHFTLAGYAIALLISLYVLWTFGRLEGLSTAEVAMTTIVLGVPAAIGAAAARLIM
ncbi:MAG: TIGR02587 family membrane protein [Bryobacteraceae bacterium]